MYLVTIQSVITALIGTRQRWQVIRRAGVFADGSPVMPTPATGPARNGRAAGHVTGVDLWCGWAVGPAAGCSLAERRRG